MLLAARASGSVCWALVEDFTKLLNRIADGFPTRQALAKALDINASRLSRALNGTDKHTSFNVENCLRLATVSGESASTVLRAANKGEIADLIEGLYGPEKQVTDSVVQDLLKEWSTFSGAEKAHVRTTVAMVLRARRAEHVEEAAVQKKRRSG